MAEVEELLCSGSEFYKLGRDLTGSGFTFRCQVRGRSMFPFLRDGDVIQVTPSGIEDLQLGDIIFYRSGDRMLAHRVVGLITTCEGKSARARGDAFLQEDPPVTEEDLVGRVELVSRRHGDDWDEIRPTEGWAGLLGSLVARSRAVHRSVRWVSRLGLRLASGRRKLRGAHKHHADGSTADMERQGL